MSPVGRIILSLTPYAAVLAGLYLAQNAWVAILSYHAVIAGVLIARRDWRGRWRGWQWATGLSAMAACALAAPAILAADHYAGIFSGRLAAELAALGLSQSSLLTFAAYYCLFNPWLEEYLWRGVLAAESPRPAWTDAAFAGYHALVLIRFMMGSWTLLGFAILLAAAWLWRQAARRHRGLIIPVASHAVADVAVVAAVIWLTR